MRQRVTALDSRRHLHSLHSDIWLLIGGLTALFALALFFYRRSLNVTFFALSADDFSRLLLAWEVTKGALIPSDIWPPLPFWITALALRIYPYPLSVPYLVNLASSACTLFGLLILGRHLGLTHAGVALLAVLLGSSPWFVWLTLSGLSEPIFFALVVAACVGMVRWCDTLRDGWLWTAAVALLGAGMVRYEGWGQLAIFTLLIAWRFVRMPASRQWTWVGAALLPWIFPIFWLGYQYVVHGSPFWFVGTVSGYYKILNRALDPLEAILAHPRYLWEVGGPIILMAPIGFWRERHRPGIGLISAFWVGAFGLLVLSALGQNFPAHNPQRSAVIFVLLALPGSAWALQRLIATGMPGISVFLVIIIAVIFPRLQAFPNYPNGLASDVMIVGQHLGGLRTLGELRPGDHTMVEVIFWDYVVLHVVINDFDRVLYDRPPKLVLRTDGAHELDDVSNPSLLALPPDQLKTALQQRQVRAVVVYSERAASNLRPIARETLQVGRFRVFLLPP